ncbi:uncharacterized protein LY89DRAFT_122665 [Mollisia scopiformis]|uniref:Uncharacterized protein n=1 Tax=Mollisia scopiformis TaxID=149040 RepID=A0A194X434_MOLSC|nr:uncharacterized protein LY89DRAFT_122665 [Mollisia scopiformis]KUJ14814.1 hypothetical protein LY89DRAFT_122665 [Mollisia scopiformis]
MLSFFSPSLHIYYYIPTYLSCNIISCLPFLSINKGKDKSKNANRKQGCFLGEGCAAEWVGTQTPLPRGQRTNKREEGERDEWRKGW